MPGWIYCSWLALATVGEGVTVQQAAQGAGLLSTLSASGIWALVALVSVVGLVKLYKDKANDDEQLKVIIKDTTAAIERNTQTLDRLNDSVTNCPKRNDK